MTNKLWQCHLHVERGTYEQMPSEWLGAAVSFYVGAPTYKEALAKAVRVAQHMGMVFVDLIGGKVVQLDPQRWWDGYVLANYPEYASWFPSQAQVLEIVRDGLVFHGPFAGWDQPEGGDAVV
jgi:hypothetical protein